MPEADPSVGEPAAPARRLGGMKVQDLMMRDIQAIPATTSAQAAARMMGELNVKALPVGDDTELAGMLTERDITIRLVAEGLSPAHTLVEQIMSSDLFSCAPDDDVADAAAAMKQRQIRQMPVLAEGRLVGLVTLAALLQAGLGKDFAPDTLTRA